MLGVAVDDVAQEHIVGQFMVDEGHRAVEEELQGGVVEMAQDATEVAGGGQAGIGVKAPGVGVGRDEGKAEDPEQGRVIDQVLAQIGHVAYVLVELDQIGSHEAGAGDRWGSRPGTMGIALRKVFPVQRGEQVQALACQRAFGDKGGQHHVGLGELRQVGAFEGNRRG